MPVRTYLEFMVVVDMLYQVNIITVNIQRLYPGLPFDILKRPLKAGFFDMLVVQVSSQLVKETIKILFKFIDAQ